MRRFRFPLEPLRRLREHRERLEQVRAAQARQALEEARARLEAEERVFHQTLQRGVAGSKLALWQALHGYILQEQQLLRQHRQSAAEAESRHAEAQRRLLWARQERLVLDRLRERALAAYQQELAQKEARQLGEIALIQYGRRRRKGP
ncbi:MAG: flagellar export protein FliJ [Bacteroidetes bacterium]|nr:flagellar export protein FliJ [Rhodothermia bacterium]MCS7154668.1 flagellar export protein FliJ [Bacteroidota bacterium]MCX7906385.1 flagellar export protein FliJ [Bacteroidota bacterium]MDW8137461.1 flagellar export protein FliJ [Bacteroidota bacterium]MDW8285585.1 flagellar export protein FliJ [Bacteroidota bacterium]